MSEDERKIEEVVLSRRRPSKDVSEPPNAVPPATRPASKHSFDRDTNYRTTETTDHHAELWKRRTHLEE